MKKLFENVTKITFITYPLTVLSSIILNRQMNPTFNTVAGICFSISAAYYVKKTLDKLDPSKIKP